MANDPGTNKLPKGGWARAEEAEEIRKLRAIVGSMADGLITFDMAGGVLDMNPAALRIHGFESVSEARKYLKGFADTFTLYDLDGHGLPVDAWPMARVLRGETFRDYEVRVRRNDTGNEWIGSYNGTPVTDRDGRAAQGVLTLRDVTEQRQAEERLQAIIEELAEANEELEVSNKEMTAVNEELKSANVKLETEIRQRTQAEEGLRRSEARWNAAIESFGEGAIIATEDEQVIYWNPAARAMHGFKSADEGIEPLEETPNTFELWTPDGSHLLELDEWPMRRIKRGETVRNLELRLRRPDQGWERIVSYSGEMVETVTGERLIFLSVYDLTEQRGAEKALRESEERLRTMVDAIPQLAWMANADGYIFWYNRRWYEYTGTTPEQMEGWGWQSVHDPEVLPAVLRRWQASIATGEPFDMEFPLKGADGQFRTFLTRVVPMKDSEGRVVRWFGTNTDVSEHRELEAHKREFYRRTILAATEGKLLISERDEIDRIAGPAVASWEVRSKPEGREVLNSISRIALDSGMDERRAYDFLGCATEATTNAIKHAGGGRVSLHETDDGLMCVVSDSGPGIGAMALPDVALTKHYSTAGTLGMGYKVMLHFADRVYLATGPEGTTVAIEMALRGEPKPSIPCLTSWPSDRPSI